MTFDDGSLTNDKKIFEKIYPQFSAYFSVFEIETRLREIVIPKIPEAMKISKKTSLN